MLADEHYYSPIHYLYSYLSQGIYVDKLKTWTSLFHGKQLLILKSEDFYQDPELITTKVFRFLGLPYWDGIQYERKHSLVYPTMDSEVKKQLTDYFKWHNERLYNYLGVNFNW